MESRRFQRERQGCVVVAPYVRNAHAARVLDAADHLLSGFRLDTQRRSDGFVRFSLAAVLPLVGSPSHCSRARYRPALHHWLLRMHARHQAEDGSRRLHETIPHRRVKIGNTFLPCWWKIVACLYPRFSLFTLPPFFSTLTDSHLGLLQHILDTHWIPRPEPYSVHSTRTENIFSSTL